jgi:hypothetical protein
MVQMVPPDRPDLRAPLAQRARSGPLAPTALTVPPDRPDRLAQRARSAPQVRPGQLGPLERLGPLEPPAPQGRPALQGRATSSPESSGPTNLTVGAWLDGQVLQRSGSTAIGVYLTVSLSVFAFDAQAFDLSAMDVISTVTQA